MYGARCGVNMVGCGVNMVGREWNLALCCVTTHEQGDAFEEMGVVAAIWRAAASVLIACVGACYRTKSVAEEAAQSRPEELKSKRSTARRERECEVGG